MPLPLELVQLRMRLQDIGVVVVEEPDHLTIRLPFFCSVQVRLVDGRLKLDAYYTLLPRMKATIIRFIVLGALCTGSIRIPAPFSLGLASLAVLAGMLEVIRW